MPPESSYPSNQAAYLSRQKLAQTRWFAGYCRTFISRDPQPGRPPVEGTSSGPARQGSFVREERNALGQSAGYLDGAANDSTRRRMGQG